MTMTESYIEYLRQQYNHLKDKTGDFVFFDDEIAEDEKVDSSGRELTEEEYSLIHTNLYPQAVTGDIEKGKLFFCVLNPGFGDSDYEDEKLIRSELIKQLSQKNASMFWLKEEYKDTGGGKYWRGLLDQNDSSKSLVENIKRAYENNGFPITKEDVFNILSRIVVDVEYYPYHSKTAPDIFSNTYRDRCKSIGRVLSFVHNELIPNAENNKQLVCFIRSISAWGVTEEEKAMSTVFCFKAPGTGRARPYFNVDRPLGKRVFEYLSEISDSFSKLL